VNAILFDLDGTLIDSTEAILDGFRYAYTKFSLPVPPKERILSLIGHPLDFMFAHLGVEGSVEPFVEAYKERYRVISKNKTTLLPTAKEAIMLAHSFAKLAVVTTKTGLYSRELLDHLGLLEFFEIVIGREDVIHPKPHPEPIIKVLHHLRTPKERAWMVGDTCLDMEAAKRAGIEAVGVSCGYGSKEQLGRCADHVKATPLEAIELIENFFLTNKLL